MDGGERVASLAERDDVNLEEFIPCNSRRSFSLCLGGGVRGGMWVNKSMYSVLLYIEKKKDKEEGSMSTLVMGIGFMDWQSRKHVLLVCRISSSSSYVP